MKVKTTAKKSFMLLLALAMLVSLAGFTALNVNKAHAMVPHEHEYTEFVEFNWSIDGTTAKAVYQCDYCGDVTEYDAEMSSVYTPATCTEAGYTTYTATYGEYSDTNDVEDEEVPDGHAYEFVGFNWSIDGTTAKALYRCADCLDEVEYDATMTAAPTTATCYEDGVITYTATYEDQEETNDVVDPAHHDYVFVDVTWPPDNKPNALLQCSHKDEYEHDNDVQGQEWLKSIVLPIAETNVVVPATCTEGGKSEYVAIYGGNRYSKVFDTPALDHDYQYAGFEWADDNL
ncbi:MAG: hypothetical protein J5762_03570, partial [Clostridia bacterium]|nr:hypothetical protein [Clostridia bacterium]